MNQLPTKATQVIQKHHGPVTVVRFDSQGEYCVSGGNDKMIYLYNPYQNKMIKEYLGHNSEVLDISICPDNSQFVSVGGDRSSFLFDVLTGKILRKFSGHTQRINCCHFNQEGNMFGTGSYDSTIRLWDCRSSARIPMQILEDAKDSVTSLQIQGYEILSGCVDGHVRNYDIRTGNLYDDYISVPITSVCFSKDNNTILISSLDNSIRLLDKSTGNVLNEYIGHENEKYKIDSCFAMNDSMIVTGSEDSIIYFYDLIDSKIFHTLQGHKQPVTSISMHPHEPTMVTASVDGTIHLWQNKL